MVVRAAQAFQSATKGTDHSDCGMGLCQQNSARCFVELLGKEHKIPQDILDVLLQMSESCHYPENEVLSKPSRLLLDLSTRVIQNDSKETIIEFLRSNPLS